MASSKRRLIIEDVVSALETITISNGYLTNLGNNVINLSTSPMVENDLSGAAVKEGAITFEPGALGLADGHFAEMSVTVDTYTKGVNAKNEIDNNIQDIVAALGVDRQRGGNAQNTELEQIEVNSDSANLTTVGASIDFNIQFTNFRFDLTR